MTQLTETQRRAVETESSQVLVIAAAGSGKTAVVTERILWLLDHGAEPHEIMVLTFTRRAASEMRDRLRERLGDDDETVLKLMMGTFHSVALTILKTYGDRLGYRPEDITVCDPDDADLLLERVCRDLGYLKGTCGTRPTWSRGLSMAKVKRYIDDYYTGTERKWPLRQHNALANIQQLYRSGLYSSHTLDFGMILMEVRQLFTDHPDVLDIYRKRIKHVLVDEVQDCDATQFDLHDFFAPPATFFGVGDRRQSIYNFRGSRPDLMTERHPDAEIIDLRECFRCADSIVETANQLISVNADPLAKPMIGATGRGGTVAVDTREISEQLREMHDLFAYSWSEIAVIARTHRILRGVQHALWEIGITCFRVGSTTDICATDHFKELHAMLRLCVNPRDNMAFMRLADGGLHPETYARIRHEAARDGISHFQAVLNEVDQGEFLSVLREYRAIHTIKDVLENLYEDESDAGIFWMHHCGDMPVPEALEWFTTYDPERGDDYARRNEVTLITAHAAKGLEWPVVIIANMEEGSLPSARSLNEEGGIEEERRLAYVAITRARETLVMHYRTEREGRDPPEPSRFVMECKKEFAHAGTDQI